VDEHLAKPYGVAMLIPALYEVILEVE